MELKPLEDSICERSRSPRLGPSLAFRYLINSLKSRWVRAIRDKLELINQSDLGTNHLIDYRLISDSDRTFSLFQREYQEKMKRLKIIFKVFKAKASCHTRFLWLLGFPMRPSKRVARLKARPIRKLLPAKSPSVTLSQWQRVTISHNTMAN